MDYETLAAQLREVSHDEVIWGDAARARGYEVIRWRIVETDNGVYHWVGSGRILGTEDYWNYESLTWCGRSDFADVYLCDVPVNCMRCVLR